MSSVVAAIDDGGQDAGFIASSSINQIVVDGPQSVPLEVVVISGGVINQAQPLSVVVQYDGEVVAGAAVTVDPYFANVSLLLHMDGSDGSTTFTDRSNNAHVITVTGNAQVSTIDPKFGTGALILDGNTDYLQTPAHSSLAFGTGDFTVECWVYPNTVNHNFGLFNIGDQLQAFLYIGEWYAGVKNVASITAPAVANSWQHFALTRSGSSLKLFINGTQVGSTTSNTTDLIQNTLYLGWYFSPSFGFNGKVDEFRITKGVARYTANFTPPTAPFPNA